MSDIKTNYIYLKSSDWSAASRSLLPKEVNQQGIIQAYKDNADRLRTNLSSSISGSFKIDSSFIKSIMDLLSFSYRMEKDKEEIAEKFNRDFFEKVNSFINQGLGETSIAHGKTNLQKLSSGKGKNGKGPLDDFNYQDFVDTVATFNDIYDQILNFDAGFKELASLTSDVVGYIGNDSLKKTVAAMNNLKSFLQKYGKNGEVTEENFIEKINQIKSDIITLSNNVISNLRGELLEYLEYLKVQMQVWAITKAEVVVQELNSNSQIDGKIHFISGAMTGEEKVLEYSTNKKYVSKSDNVVALQFNSNNNEFSFILKLGISDKAYKKANTGSKRIANALSWESVFSHTVPQSLTESQFQYYYANLVVFDPEKIRTPKASLENRYLAAKAAAFLIAGVEKGSISQAYFIRYGDTIEYIPDLLEQIAKGDQRNFGISSFFTLSEEGQSSKQSKKYKITQLSKYYGGQKFVQQEGPTAEDRWNAAHKRSITTLGLLRERLKFDANR